MYKKSENKIWVDSPGILVMEKSLRKEIIECEEG